MTIGSIGSSSISTYSMNSMRRPQGPPPSNAEDMVSNILKNEDTDGDGVISSTETKMDSKMFKEIDADGDGNLTTEELTTDAESRIQDMADRLRDQLQGGGGAMGMQGPPSASDMAANLIEREDSDGDGMISASETQMGSNMFKEIDSDGDGYLTTDELETDAEKRIEEMQSKMTEETQSAALSSTNIEAILEAFKTQSASNAYSNQDWLSSFFESQASGLSINA